MTEKKISFKKKDIEYPERDAIEELMEIYEENETPIDKLDHKGITSKKADNGEDRSLKEMIEEERRAKKKRTAFFFIFVLAMFVIAALSGFIYFSQFKPYGNDDVVVEIDAPEKIIIGETFEYVIEYENKGNVALTNSKLSVVYPHGFMVEKTEPETGNHSWELGELDLYERGEVVIKGKIIDTVDVEQKLSVTLSFYPENFNSEFSHEQNYSVLVEQPHFEILDSHLANVGVGQNLNIKTKIKNESDITYNNVRITLETPDGFSITKSQPEAFAEENEWLLPLIIPENESEEISIDGLFDESLVFENNDERIKKFNIKVDLADDEEQFYNVFSKEFEIKIIDQKISTYLSINGSGQDKSIFLGDDLVFSAIFKNTGEQEFENVTATARINCRPADVLSWEDISEERMGSISNDDKGKVISWNNVQIDELSSFASDDEVILTFTIPTKDIEDLDGYDPRSLAQSEIVAYAQMEFEDENIKPISSSPVRLTINSDLALMAKTVYHFDDGTPIGSGPLPMRVGETTKLNVFWDLTNSLHELDNIIVYADLPEYATWHNSANVSVGTLDYDESTRRVSWTINMLPESINEVQASFAINITPEESHRGEILKLTGITTVSAKDSETKDLIIRTKNISTSALEFDEYYEGDGIVQ
jgi:hypothetical protein